MAAHRSLKPSYPSAGGSLGSSPRGGVYSERSFMEIYTSYFYQVRNMRPHMIPLSTAVWPPKWFHKNGHCFVDKNGVLNGAACSWLRPGESCDGLCRGRNECKQEGPRSCEFLKVYRKQLDKLDFQTFIQKLEQLGGKAKEMLGFEEEPVIILMFHEKYDNPCSEREVVKQWFKDNGIELKEFNTEII